MTVQIINGDLLAAFDKGDVNVIGHCCNMQNKFGSGLAKSIKERYPEAYEADTYWHEMRQSLVTSYTTPSCSVAHINNYQIIFNLYGQEFYGREKRQLNYGRFSNCLRDMSSMTCRKGLEIIGFPYLIGCNLAGGDWEIVLEMIEYYFRDHEVKIYRLEK